MNMNVWFDENVHSLFDSFVTTLPFKLISNRENWLKIIEIFDYSCFSFSIIKSRWCVSIYRFYRRWKQEMCARFVVSRRKLRTHIRCLLPSETVWCGLFQINFTFLQTNTLTHESNEIHQRITTHRDSLDDLFAFPQRKKRFQWTFCQ